MAPNLPPRPARYLPAQKIIHQTDGVKAQIGTASFGVSGSYGQGGYTQDINATTHYSNFTLPYGNAYEQQAASVHQGQPSNHLSDRSSYKQLQSYEGSQTHGFTSGANGSHQQSYGHPAMDYSQWNNAQYSNQQYNYQYPASYDPYAQQQQYQPTPPQIRNPFAPPPTARTHFNSQNAQHDPEYEAQIAQWQSAYAPQDPFDKSKKDGKAGKGENPNFTNIGVRQGPVQGPTDTHEANVKVPKEEKKKTVVRKGGGETWEDDSLLEWDPTQFRIMVGNLAGEVTDDSLFKAFASYGPSKARVVRDKRTTKSKGFGFVAFTDGENGFKAAREMVGKYIGSHPVTIQRAKTDVRPVSKKEKDKSKNKNKNKEGKADDSLRAHTGAHIEKKPIKNPAGYKILG